MKDKNIKIGISEIKGIVMTDAEKKRIYEGVLSTVNKPSPVKSPWSFSTISFIFTRTRFAYYVIIPLVFVLSGSGAVFASEKSLPNNLLYPLKVKVVEPIKGALKLNPKSKAKYESSLASKRLLEAEVLATENKLDLKKEEKLNRLLVKHTEALNDALEEVNTSEIDEDSESISNNFQIEMNDHARVIDMLTKKELYKEDNENKEDKKIDKFKDGTISNTARVGAEKIRNISNKKEDNKKLYDEKKKEKEKGEEIKKEEEEDVKENKLEVEDKNE